MAETRATCWRLIAGPELASRSFRFATVPDGPGLDGWKDGDVERIEAKNRQLLVQHFARLAAAPTVARPQGSPPASDPDARVRVAALISTIPDDLSIPSFLRRKAEKTP
jgi:hypothetical protein